MFPADMSAIDTAQLNYMRKVLGLDRVLVPQGVAPALEIVSAPALLWKHSDPAKLSSAKFVAFFPLEARDFPLQGEAESLVDKMIRAMKVNPNDVFIVQYSGASEQLQQFDYLKKPIVVFGDFEAAKKGAWTDWRGTKLLSTHSPRELLESPDKKRLAWVQLQVVMKEL